MQILELLQSVSGHMDTRNGTTVMENSVDIPQNLKNTYSMGPSDPPSRLKWKLPGLINCPVHIASQ